MKPEDARKVLERHRKQATEPTRQREVKAPALSLLDGFREHGLAVVAEPTTKPSA